MERRVVITGMGAITPVGNNLNEYWNGISSGKNGIDYITKFDTTDYKVKIAAEVKGFDPLDYMDKLESKKEDLFSQYAVAAATQAVEDSGLQDYKELNKERFGVYVGTGTGGMNTFIEEAKKLNDSGPRKINPFFVPMMIGNMATGNIAIKFGAQGPSLPVVTACATATNAIGEAFRAIKHGYADAMISGGAEATIINLSIAGFTNCMALTTRNEIDACSIPFDKRRDGFVMGEGAGILILEEYEHALKRGAKIYAEVCGYGNTCDAHHMTAPHPEGFSAIRAMKQAISEGGMENEDRIYINAHGTSTPLNDKTETLVIKSALGEEKARKAKISSTKSMTGHMLGAAGAVEAIATVMALKEGVIPPTIGYKETDPDCDLDITPNVAVKEQMILGLSNSLGFGGHNACLAFRKYEGK